MELTVHDWKCIFVYTTESHFFFFFTEKISSLRVIFYKTLSGVCVLFPLIIFYTKIACLDSMNVGGKYSEFVLYIR